MLKAILELISQKVFVVNELKNSTSLYLLQHAENPVYWKEYSDSIWEKAREEDKLVLLSIGYSSCHWCHVMEHEVFENETCAQVMNEKLICVKIDKEERPDLDMIYMDATHILNKPGGWPLNVFCLPNGKPIHSETFVPKSNWISLIDKLSDLFENRREDVMAYGHQIFKVVEQIQSHAQEESLEWNELAEVLLARADKENGGFGGAPKFPMPGLLSTLLRLNTAESIEHAVFTVKKILQSGLYDHVEGGIYRYSVDNKWGVPHFEKMLYDNAQFLELLCDLIQLGFNEFESHAKSCFEFLVNQFGNENKLFGASFDADCEGKEGAYYTLTKEELISEFEAELDTSASHWMEEYYVPALKEKVWRLSNLLKEKLSGHRKHKPKPTKDFKTVASWNSMALVACWKYYTINQDPLIRNQVEQFQDGIFQHFLYENKVYRISLTHATEGFLDDYAWMLRAVLESYKHTLNDELFVLAQEIAHRIEHSFLNEYGNYLFSSSNEKRLPKKLDLIDQVTPSSNAKLFESFLLLNAISDQPFRLEELPKLSFPMEQWKWISNHLLTQQLCSVKLVGENAKALGRELISQTSKVHIAKAIDSTDGITIYVCRNQLCFPPVNTLKDALDLIHS